MTQQHSVTLRSRSQKAIPLKFIFLYNRCTMYTIQIIIQTLNNSAICTICLKSKVNSFHRLSTSLYSSVTAGIECDQICYSDNTLLDITIRCRMKSLNIQRTANMVMRCFYEGNLFCP